MCEIKKALRFSQALKYKVKVNRNAQKLAFLHKTEYYSIMSNSPISAFIEKHYRHFNAAALVDAAKGYQLHLAEGGKMMVTLAGAMSTAELGKSLAEIIRQDKVQIISCTGANLEEDLMNLVALLRPFSTIITALGRSFPAILCFDYIVAGEYNIHKQYH